MSVPVAVVLIEDQSRVGFTPVPDVRVCPVQGACADDARWTAAYDVFGHVWKNRVQVAIVIFGATVRGQANRPRVLLRFKGERIRHVKTRQIRGQTLHHVGAFKPLFPYVRAVGMKVPVARAQCTFRYVIPERWLVTGIVATGSRRLGLSSSHLKRDSVTPFRWA